MYPGWFDYLRGMAQYDRQLRTFNDNQLVTGMLIYECAGCGKRHANIGRNGVLLTAMCLLVTGDTPKVFKGMSPLLVWRAWCPDCGGDEWLAGVSDPNDNEKEITPGWLKAAIALRRANKLSTAIRVPLY